MISQKNMSSIIDNQSVQIQQLLSPKGVGVATNSSPSLTALAGSLAYDTTTPGSLYVGNGSTWVASGVGSISLSSAGLGAPIYASIPSTASNKVINSIAGDSDLIGITIAPPFTGGDIVIGKGPNAVTTTNVKTISNKLYVNPAANMLYGTTATPSVVLGAGAGGAGAAFSILGNDMVGSISVTIGAAPPAGLSVIAIITLTAPTIFRPQPLISLTGVSPVVASIPGVITAGFQSSSSWAIVNFGTSALDASVTYTWNYFVPAF